MIVVHPVVATLTSRIVVVATIGTNVGVTVHLCDVLVVLVIVAIVATCQIVAGPLGCDYFGLRPTDSSTILDYFKLL
jgi:hypothetical protein